ncbi:MAG: anthranilate synthase component II [Alteromonadaceae bacterium]|nr:anthranilate synthase component II [Alteromonadaceae bacterium]
MKHLNVVMLDNIDSFTYNLVDELRTLDVNMRVYRNTVDVEVIVDALSALSQQGPTLLLLSPGPGAPHEAGCMPELIQRMAGQVPILGICLGHQAIVEFCGGTVVRAEAVVHGKASLLTHCGDKMFANMPQPMSIARYHSLAAGLIPDNLEVLGHVYDIPMVVFEPKRKMLGMQFHPESILTHSGSQLLRDSIDYLLGTDGTQD